LEFQRHKKNGKIGKGAGGGGGGGGAAQQKKTT